MLNIDFSAKRNLAFGYSVGDNANIQIELETYDKRNTISKNSQVTMSGRRIESLRNIKTQIDIATIAIPPEDIKLWEMFQMSVAAGEPFVYGWPEETDIDGNAVSRIAQVVGEVSLNRVSNGGYNKKSASFTVEII